MGDSAKFSESNELTPGATNCWGLTDVGNMRWFTDRGLKVVGRGRLVRARCGPRGHGLRGGSVFPGPELDVDELLLLLLLSSTETGLEVRNLLSEDSFLTEQCSFPSVKPPQEKESSTNVESHSSWTISSSYKNKRENDMIRVYIKLYMNKHKQQK